MELSKDIKIAAEDIFYSENEVVDFATYLLKWEGYLPENMSMCLAIWKKYPVEPPIEKGDRPRKKRTASAIHDIIRITCKYYDVPLEVVGLKTRKREVLQARQIAMFIARHLTNTPFEIIGKKLGGKHHATVLHAFRKVVPNMIETDPDYRVGLADVLSIVSDEVPQVSRKAYILMRKVEEGKVN